MIPFYTRTARFVLPYSLLFLLLLGSLPSLAQITRYVALMSTNPNPATATSWAAATPDLQGAINASSPGDRVWINSGVYKPSGTATDPRANSFIMKAGVAIYGAINGGFGGIETSQRPQRDPTSPFSTTLSGDIGRPNDLSDNSYHVIKNAPGLDKTAILDGFVITGGNADRRADADDYGGGIYNDGTFGKTCSPTIRNCFFVGNKAIQGGAMMNNGFQGNSSPVLENCIFQGNSAVESGGTLYNSGGQGRSDPTITACLFQGNSALNGGAMFNDGNRGNSTPNLINCSFQSNTATESGGALFNQGWPRGTSNPNLTNCSFQSNSAPNGGAMTNDAGVNVDPGTGTSIPTLVNCVFFNNGAAKTIHLRNNDKNAQATYSLFDESVTGYTVGPTTKKTTVSPFASPNGTQLACGSPAVNAGNKDTPGLKVVTTDLGGNPRVDGGLVDMGAYELQGKDLPRTLYVNANLTTGNNTGLDWPNAFRSLQDALNFACGSFSSEIWVAKGLYTPTTGTDRSISFSMENNVGIYGGFDGTETTRAARKLTFPSSTTLSGDIGKVNDISDNSYHVFFNPGNLTNTAILDGFVITAGNAKAGGTSNRDGGGMYNNGSGTGQVCNPLIRNCSFQGNSAVTGGAMFNNGASRGTSSPVLINCVFQSNSANIIAGAIYNHAFDEGTSSPQLTNCSFQGNSAPSAGAMRNYTGDGGTRGITRPTLTNCVFFNNGGDKTFESSPVNSGITASHSLFEESVTDYTGGPGNLTVIAGGTSPFVNSTSPQLACGSPAINKGDLATTTATIGATDLAGNIRFHGGRVDMGAFEQRIVAGEIGFDGPSALPYPLEKQYTLTSRADASTSFTPSTVFWQQNISTAAPFWRKIPGTEGKQTLPLPTLSVDGPYEFRRVAGCGIHSDSIRVTIKVSDGEIHGKVTSKDGTEINGTLITLVRTTTGLTGTSPVTKTWSTTTGNGGAYTFTGVYYGLDTGPASVTASTFTITPSFTDPNSATLVHKFDPASRSVTLDASRKIVSSQNFIDSTAISLTGKTVQTCPDCITGGTDDAPINGPLTCPAQGVEIGLVRNGTQLTRVFSQTGGFFATSVGNPGTYQITAKKGSLVFASQPINVQGSVKDLVFSSPTSQTITGRVRAGCGVYIGEATLEFADLSADSSSLNCFRKQVTTQNGGQYTIVLPARLYKVRAIRLSSPQNTTAPNTSVVETGKFTAFVNQLPRDSLIRNLTSATAVTTLNLTYQQPPTLRLSGLTPAGCSNNATATFSVLRQGVPKVLTVAVFQGPAKPNETGCPISSGPATVTMITNIERGGTDAPPRSLTLIDGVSSLTLVPGVPNALGNHYRTLTLNYRDLGGQLAEPVSYTNVAVIGAVSSGSNFLTTSPEIPLLVLHDPPGDNSYSSWSKGTTQERAVRFYVGKNIGGSTWLDVKLGVKYETGVGVEVGSAFWGTLGAGVDVNTRNGTADETIVATTTTQELQTSADPRNVGADADVFYGAALNMSFSRAFVVDFNPNTCRIDTSSSMMIDSLKTKTTYIYTAADIRTVTIPKLESARNQASDPDEKAKWKNQISVWQQVLANNDANKRRATFEPNKPNSNKSFGQGAIFKESTSKAVSEANTIEFSLDIDTKVATSLGFEYGGSGSNLLGSVNFKMESGNSKTTTNTSNVTTDYTLQDNSTGDQITVDVKVDPVYGTPVFDVLGGQTSCPPEDNTVARDQVQVTADPPRLDVPKDETANLRIYIGNLNKEEARTYRISLIPSSNPDGAVVKINGAEATNAQPVDRAAGGTDYVTVSVKRGDNSTVYSYQNLRFQVEDGCGQNVIGGGTVLETVDLSVLFKSECSAVALSAPPQEWVSRGTDNGTLPVQISGYTPSALTSIEFQYRPPGKGSGWITTEKLPNAKNPLLTIASGTPYIWNMADSLSDGAYELRLKLTCPQGVVYSQSVNGHIERNPPVPIGNTQPTNGVYVTGGTIGITYSEPIDCSRITTNSVIAKRNDGTSIAVSVGCTNNQVVVLPPPGSLATSEVVSLTLLPNSVADLYGNLRTAPDSWTFNVGSTTAATGVNALSVVVVNSPLSESATSTMKIVFNRSEQAKSTNWSVNFALTGTARLASDYTISYANSTTALQPLVIDGASGSIRMLTGVTSVTLVVAPINDSAVEPDETVIISLLAGGDYQISAASSVTAVIRNDDQPPTGSSSLTLTTSASPAAVCAGSSVALSVSATGGTTPYTYTWIAPAGATLSATSTSAVSASVSTSGVRTFTVTVAGPGGLSLTTGTVSVTVNAPPTPTLSTGPSATLTCTQTSLTLTAGGGTTGGASAYRFAGPGITSQNPTAGTAVVNASGTYSVTVTNASGCAATASTIVVESNSSQRTQITVQPASASVVTAGTTIGVSVSATGTTLTYQWSKDGAKVADATTNVLSLTGATTSQSGTYVCAVSGDCGSVTSQAFVLTVNAPAIILAVVEPVIPFVVEVYPNPAMSDRVWVKIQGAARQSVHLQLLNMQGRVVWDRTVKVTTAAHSEPLDIGNFPAGLLLLRASTAEQSQIIKLLKP